MNEIKTDENLRIKGFFDNQTSTISYVVHDNIEKKCAVKMNLQKILLSTFTFHSVFRS